VLHPLSKKKERGRSRKKGADLTPTSCRRHGDAHQSRKRKRKKRERVSGVRSAPCPVPCRPRQNSKGKEKGGPYMPFYHIAPEDRRERERNDDPSPEQRFIRCDSRAKERERDY